MPSVSIKTQAGADAGNLDLDGKVFGLEPNVPVMHQVVTAQLAARRAGTHSTKRRREVRGGGAKPWRQKGTGRARQGSIRAPHWRGGGVALGPKPRDYSQRTPKKMVRLALRSALSDRAAEGKVVVVDSWTFAAPKTKDAIAALDALGITGRALVVVPADDRNTWLSFRNLASVHVISPGELNAYDVLVADYVVFTADSVPTATEPVKDKAPKPAARPKPAAAPKPAAPAADETASAEPAAAAPVEDTTSAPADDAGGDAPGGDDDMASDLPNRPKLSDEEKARNTVIDPTDRVKSVADKTDPRFEAAKNKADKEDRLRAAAEAKASASVDAAPEDEAADEDESGSGFSFKNTGERS